MWVRVGEGGDQPTNSPKSSLLERADEQRLGRNQVALA